MKTHLHIGLNKTATTFFRYHVFPLFDPVEIIYNPPAPLDCLHRSFTLMPMAGGQTDAKLALAKSIVSGLTREGKTERLLISEEDLSQRCIPERADSRYRKMNWELIRYIPGDRIPATYFVE